MKAARLVYTIPVHIMTDDLRSALESHGMALTNETMFRARYQIKDLLEKSLSAILEQAANRISVDTSHKEAK